MKNQVKIDLSPEESLMESQFEDAHINFELGEFDAILGFIKSGDGYLLTIARTISPVFTTFIDQDEIYKIQEVEFFELGRGFYDNIDEIKQNLKEIFAQGMYMSFKYDLTSRHQRQEFLKEHKLKTERTIDWKPLWQRADSKYFWNYNMCAN